ncbi:hypothetical protein NQ318_001856 [Aromia moschata]|uniref:RING-type domain-containing protein n=1 Tax=Aromia moschata TaxID=1265417 RepID=A0AAV8Z1R3_9CUCU|nr:hypothetical protein NQ318_001856 [Aromia moschata]
MEVERRINTPSPDTLSTLKCSFCDCYLTVTPVSIVNLQGDAWKCGRCFYVKTEYSVPALLYEKIAADMTFPCSFGCGAELPFYVVRGHEGVCRHQPIKCPCGETVQMRSVVSHFHREHPGRISYARVVVEQPGNGRLVTRLLLTGRLAFLVYVLYERLAEIKVGVYALGENYNTYEAHLKVTTRSRSSQVTIPGRRIRKYCLRDNCPDCLLRTCQIEHHRYFDRDRNSPDNAAYKAMNFRVNTLSILNVLDPAYEDLTLIVEISKRDALEERTTKTECARKAWECPVCEGYLVGQVYVCPTGHSLCRSCKPKLMKCPLCEVKIGDSRNFTLEAIGETAVVACRHARRGCSFSGSLEEAVGHEGECSWEEEEERVAAKKRKTNA